MKVGLSDGVNTEITGGIAEGAVIVSEAVLRGQGGQPETPSGERSPFMPGPPGSDKNKNSEKPKE